MMVAVAVVVGLVAGAVSVPLTEPSPQRAQAADLSQFRPGNIIADRVFFNPSTMNEGQVQSFLESKVPRCTSGYTCLRNYAQTTTNKPADAYCRGYSGGWESASRIIVKVAQSCGINPQVLIVTLQKETSLVTLAAPESLRYRKAMGYGCPDTASCDSDYYGFFNQVYSAARQFRVYGQSSTFTWYAPGKTWDVRFHPNAACGSSRVYIENQATANLYYYTPYQPNGAALAAGYGTGDGCSAYGNRNFFQFFTDWFGSTQSPVGAIVRGDRAPEIYLVTGGVKRHISDFAEYVVLSSRLGAFALVAQNYVDSIPTSTPATRYVHDARTGTLYLLQADGTKHRFTSAAQIKSFGYDFNSYINLEPYQADAFATGDEVGALFRIDTDPRIYSLVGGTSKRHIPTMASFTHFTEGTSGFVAGMSSAGAAKLADGPALIKPNSLLRETSSGDVYLSTGDQSLIHIPSFGLAAEFGATPYDVVPDGTFARQTITAGDLSPFITCGAGVLIGSSGKVSAVVGSTPTGWSPTSLSSDACASMVQSGTVQAPIFIGNRTTGAAYLMEGGKLKHVLAYADLVRLNGNRPLTVLTWSADTVAFVGLGAPILSEGSVVQFDGDVYLYRGGELHHVERYSDLLRIGGGKVPRIETISGEYRSTYPMGVPYS